MIFFKFQMSVKFKNLNIAGSQCDGELGHIFHIFFSAVKSFSAVLLNHLEQVKNDCVVVAVEKRKETQNRRGMFWILSCIGLFVLIRGNFTHRPHLIRVQSDLTCQICKSATTVDRNTFQCSYHLNYYTSGKGW